MSLQRPSVRYGTPVLFGMLLLVLLASPILASQPQQDCATMAFNPIAVSEVKRGDIVLLQLPLDANGVTFDVAGFLINFDQTFLQVVDAAGDPASQIEPGDLPGTNIINTASNVEGTIEFAQSITGGQDGGAFTVATIRFEVITTWAAGSRQVTFVDGLLGNTGVYLAGTPLLCEFPGPATITLLTVPVGGIVVPVSKLGLFAPCLGLVAVVLLVAALAVVMLRKRKT